MRRHRPAQREILGIYRSLGSFSSGKRRRATRRDTPLCTRSRRARATRVSISKCTGILFYESRALSHTLSLCVVCVCVCVCVCITGGNGPAAQVRILCSHSHALQQQLHVWLRRARQCQCAKWDVCFPSVFTVRLGFPPGHYSAYLLATAVVATGTAAIATAARPPPLMGLPLRASAGGGARSGVSRVSAASGGECRRSPWGDGAPPLHSERRPCASRLARRHSPVASSADRAPALCCCGTGTRQASSKRRSRRVVSLPHPRSTRESMTRRASAGGRGGAGGSAARGPSRIRISARKRSGSRNANPRSKTPHTDTRSTHPHSHTDEWLHDQHVGWRVEEDLAD